MQRTRIKICGVTHPDDARQAAEAGADAIGMVFHPPSARNVPLERAEAILKALPPFATPVGLFVDAPIDDVQRTIERLGLRHVQLHGHESPDYLRQVRATILKAVRVDRQTFAEELQQWRDAIAAGGMDHLRGFVLETPAPPGGAPGGTGVANDWATVREYVDSGKFTDLPPMIAAGGLTPENVAEVIRSVRPWAVDVSSGVEGSVKGRKYPARLRRFFDEVRAADRG